MNGIDRMSALHQIATDATLRPPARKSPKALGAFVREVALKEGGEAWWAMTDRGELLRLFSVSDLADELSGRKTITLHDDDPYHLGVAHGWLDLPPPPC
jgi:hypothetical protein